MASARSSVAASCARCALQPANACLRVLMSNRYGTHALEAGVADSDAAELDERLAVALARLLVAAFQKSTRSETRRAAGAQTPAARF